jgi:penicillin-binding protein 1C
VPSYDEVRSDHRSSETLLLSREGEVLQRLRTDSTVRRGPWVALADVSPALRTALVLSEDKRFYEHSGVDWAAVTRRLGQSLEHAHARREHHHHAARRSAGWRLASGTGRAQRGAEGGAGRGAQVLDRRWRKDQILEAYLNLVPFRGEIVGIAALSQSLYGKAAHGLDAREAAIAAALVRAPNASVERVAQRACGVLQVMVPDDVAAKDCSAMQLYTSSVLQRRQWLASEGVAPHLRGAGWRCPRTGGRSRCDQP